MTQSLGVRLLATLGLCVALLAVAVPARATPLASARADVDRDGTADTVTVEPDGRVVVARAGSQGAAAVASAELQAPDKVGAAQVSVEEIQGHQVIVARATLPGRAKGDPWSSTLAGGVFEWDAGALAPLWRGLLGPQGQDGEWTVALETMGDALLLYESRPDLTSCDGARVRLYQQALDFGEKRFRPVSMPPSAPASAVAIAPVRSAPAGLDARTRPSVFRFQSASTQSGDGGNAEGLAAPRELDDGDVKTAWAEGLGGWGKGEILVARGGSDRYGVHALRVIPGDAASSAAFAAANRLKRLVLIVGAAGYMVEWPSDPAQAGKPEEPWWIVLPQPVAAGCVSVAIDEVYFAKKGTKGRTAVAELTVFTEVEAGGAKALEGLAEQVATRSAGWTDAEHHLIATGGAGAQAALAAMSKDGRTDQERRRLRALLAEIQDPAAARELVVAVREAKTAKERRVYEEALDRQAGAVVTELIALAGDGNALGGARAAAARVLGGVAAPEARAALVTMCGVGDRALRTAVADALGKRDVGELARAVEEATAAASAAASGSESAAGSASATASACEADRWRIVARIARRGGPADARATAAKAAAARLAEVTDYERRYRLLQALGALAGEEGAAAAIESALRGEKEPALRTVAVDAVGAKITRPLFDIAIADQDPGVRLAALAGIARGEGDGGDDRAVLDRLAKDKWAAVRTAAARVLGRRCGRAGISQALLAAVGGDDSDDVRQAGLEALVACKEPGLGPKLNELARDRNLSARLREYATSQIARTGDPKAVDDLITLLADARSNSIGDEDNMRVAAAAAWALGTLKDRRATEALLDAASDPTFPAIRAAALAAVGEFCPPGSGQAIAHALASDEPEVVRAAKLAQKKCKK